MARTLAMAALVMAGCMTGDPIDEHSGAIVDGAWVLAPDVSDRPVLAGSVPAGVLSAPVDLVRVDGMILVCQNGVPVDGLEDGGDDGEEPPGLRPVPHNAPLDRDSEDEDANVGTGTVPSDVLGGGLYDDEEPLSDTDLDRLRNLPEDVWLFHAGCL